jgi:nickel-dependent lactate racemase
VAECRDGIGGQNFETWLREADDADEVLQRIRREFVLGGNKVFSIALTTKKAQIYLVSDLPPILLDECWRMPGLHHFSSLEKALGSALSNMGSNAEIVVMPKGNSTLPMLEKG